MAKLSRPRKGSLQFWPRNRAAKFLHRVNWSTIKTNSSGLLGFIAYKVRMVSTIVKDNTDKSMSKGKRIVLPSTVLEVPPMKLFSIRFYKNNIVLSESIVSSDKELKHVLKTPKTPSTSDSIKIPQNFDDVRAIVYSVPKTISLKNTPDLIEVAVNAPSKEEKINFLKSIIGKELKLADLLKDAKLLDARGLTRGHGLVGPVRRFGITLKSHKSEKGVRRPGSLGPWHPAYVMFRTPMAGQLGLFSRTQRNLVVLSRKNVSESDITPKGGFLHYGTLSGDYIILAGSVQGPSKRQILLTPPARPTKHTIKKSYELVEVVP